MIVALIAVLVALVVAVVLPSPWCLLALLPWVIAGWFCIQSIRGRWDR